MSVGLKWKLVLKSHHALKKPCIHGKLEFIMQLKASCPHFRIWALFLLSIPSFASIISAQWSSSLSVAYLLIQEIFKDLKKFRAPIKLKPPSPLSHIRYLGVSNSCRLRPVWTQC